MVVSIIGWYGTETLGDLAILDGILAVIREIEPVSIVKIGSLYPFYTQRTFYEEKQVFHNTAPGIKLEIFDVKDKGQANSNINQSDCLIIGGGPLMDLEELLLLRNCFQIALKRGIPRIVMGCGVGPLTKDRYIGVVKDIISMASGVYLRDQLSLQTTNRILGDVQNASVLGDPAIISIENFKQGKRSGSIKDKKILAVNFREYFSNEYGAETSFSTEQCRKIIERVRKEYDEICLIPMHTFAIGGDDRLFLARIVSAQKYENVSVKHSPMNLYELYQVYADATACIGMRYHSVVMQTILNGNNYIVEYTNPMSGKIAGFIKYIDKNGFYSDRRWSIRDELRTEDIDILLRGESYKYRMSNMKKEYVEATKKHLI